ncbi:MAG: hypothetical protein NC189_09040, partial [Bacteroides sp.]|nr:hypothetical protein [Bacteroides sp.]
PDWTRSKDGQLGATSRTGVRGGLSVGDWVSPVHGWRVNIETGRHKGMYGSDPFFVGLSADYMMNLSTLLKGDNPDRRFELTGFAGLEFEWVHRCHFELRNAFGVHFGLQPRAYITPNTFVYIEPRIGIFSDNIDIMKTWHKYDWNASLMVGIGYRMRPVKRRFIDNSLFDNSSFRDHLFFGVSGGMNLSGSGTENFAHRLGSDLSFFAGKWFTPSSGVRILGGIGDLKRPEIYRRWAGHIDVDYLWNISSCFNGYDPDRKFDTNILLGASGMVTNGHDHRFNPALHVGIQGIYNINPTIGLFIEPGVKFFAKHFNGLGTDRSNIMTGVNLGFIYRSGSHKDYLKHKSEFQKEDFLNSRRYFFDFKGGVYMNSREWERNFTAGFAVGKWLSPGNALRVTGEFDFMHNSEGTGNFRSLTMGLDYLGSLTTLMNGYDPDQVFDLDVVLGVSAGGAHYKSKYNRVIWGPHAGLRAAVRLSPSLDFILEPRLEAMRIPHYGRKFTPQAHFMAGLSFKPKGRVKYTSGNEAVLMTNEFERNFVSVTGGPTLFSETLIGGQCDAPDWYVDASAGRWFSKVSGLQLGLSYDFIDRKWRDPHLNVGTLHLDYLLNFSALVTGLPDTRFSLTGIVGTGLGWSNHNAGYVSPEVELGLIARYRLNSQFSISFNPSMAFWRPALNQNRGNNHHFIGVGRMPLGLTYHF